MMKHASVLPLAAALILAGLAAFHLPARAQESEPQDSGAGEAALQEAPAIALELNRVEDVAGGCRIYLVTRNGLDVPLDPFTLDFVAFDRGDVIVTRLAVDLAPVPPAKTMVRLFDIAGPACADLSALLLNDVVACTAGTVRDRACLEQLGVASRAGIDLRL